MNRDAAYMLDILIAARKALQFVKASPWLSFNAAICARAPSCVSWKMWRKWRLSVSIALLRCKVQFV